MAETVMPAYGGEESIQELNSSKAKQIYLNTV